MSIRTWTGLPKRQISACVSAFLFLLATPAFAANSVTQWTELADAYGNGLANWRTQAIMHQAVHDVLNAIEPRFERWAAPTEAEPSAAGALPGAAIASAAAQVLLLLHPSRQEDTERALRLVLEGHGVGSDVRAGIKLGKAIGRAVVERRDSDGSLDIRPFASSTETGSWARTPLQYATSNTSSTLPFLSSLSEVTSAPPPPALDSDVYRDSLDEVRGIGAVDSEQRTDTQTKAAFFWASQSSHGESGVGMGQHEQISGMGARVERWFESLDAAAHECSESRIWAGAHIRPGCDEARRLGLLIAARAAAAVPRIR